MILFLVPLQAPEDGVPFLSSSKDLLAETICVLDFDSHFTFYLKDRKLFISSLTEHWRDSLTTSAWMLCIRVDSYSSITRIHSDGYMCIL